MFANDVNREHDKQIDSKRDRDQLYKSETSHLNFFLLASDLDVACFPFFR
jgi:hypothetical protein